LITLINKLNNVIPNFLVVFDGTCSVDFNDNSIEHITAEREIVKSVLDQIRNVKSISLIGEPAFLSIFGASKCSFYIAPWGAGLTKYQILANKTGVVHTNIEVIKSWSNLFYCWERIGMSKINYSQPLLSLDYKDHVIKAPIDNRGDQLWFNNYQADPEDLFKSIAEYFKVI
jgi:hypothetical protein